MSEGGVNPQQTDGDTAFGYDEHRAPTDYEALANWADRFADGFITRDSHTQYRKQQVRACAAALRQAAQDEARIEALERVVEAARIHARREGWPSKIADTPRRRYLAGGTALALIDALATLEARIEEETDE